jgi:hypothetical protein
MAKPFDHEYETSEAGKFKTLAAICERTDTIGLSERFSILAALCEEKAKILKELVEQVVFDLAPPEGKLLERPNIADLPVKKRFGDN